MAVHWIEVAEALRAAIAEQLEVTVERRYSAIFEKADVEDGKYLVIGMAEDLIGKRGIDHLEIAVDVGYERALPDPTENYPDPKSNIPWLDAEVAKVEAIKDLFAAGDEEREAGPLRDADFAGATYLRWTHSPLVRPDWLKDQSIFLGVVRFEFRIEN